MNFSHVFSMVPALRSITFRSCRPAGEKIGIRQGRALTRSQVRVEVPVAVVGPSPWLGDGAPMLKLELAI